MNVVLLIEWQQLHCGTHIPSKNENTTGLSERRRTGPYHVFVIGGKNQSSIALLFDLVLEKMDLAIQRKMNFQR